MISRDMTIAAISWRAIDTLVLRPSYITCRQNNSAQNPHQVIFNELILELRRPCQQIVNAVSNQASEDTGCA
jgi:hypothetical protein